MKFAKCHPDRKHCAKGLCSACYEKVRRETNPEYKKQCIERSTKWRHDNPQKWEKLYLKIKKKRQNDPGFKETNREGWLKRKYGIVNSDYLALKEKQKNCCAVCHLSTVGTRDLVVDYDDKKQKVRGLVCRACLRVLDGFKEDNPLRIKVLEYLKT